MTMDSSTDINELIASARRQHRAGAGSVLDVLLRTAGREEAALLRRLREGAGVDAVSSGEGQADFSALDLKTAAAWRCVVLKRPGLPGLWLGMEDPWNDEVLRRAERQVRASLEPVALRSADLKAWLDLAEGAGSTESRGAAMPANDSARADGPIVAFVDTAVKSAFEAGASDIHFECDRKGVTVKLRQDGVMARFARLEGVQPAQEVISRIKVLAQLDITERRVPQDGRFRFTLPGHGEGGIDLRVSIMPSVFGEDAVLRLLDKAQLRASESPVSLDLLGFDAEGAQLIRDLANEPSGMLLVTGPTGSGKTTTVYAALTEINTGRRSSRSRTRWSTSCQACCRSRSTSARA